MENLTRLNILQGFLQKVLLIMMITHLIFGAMINS